MKNLVIVVVLLLSSVSFAQKFTFEGVVKDDQEINLEAATVFVQGVQDSLVLAYGITNKDGRFSIKVDAEQAKKIVFNIAYLGYKPYNKVINVPQADFLDAGVIVLNDDLEKLEVVSIIATSPPILIKKDTIEYNASSFKTQPNDRAEDLLKKLPGIEIDIDGNITINGTEVESVNIDGMSFFGEKKGETALKNLPSDIISKIQITDYKTDRQKFTGEASDSGTKEINIKIKKGKNNAFFGDLNGGLGTDKKYQVNTNLFKLVEGEQIGLISGTNNINMRKGFNALPDAVSSNGYTESDFIGTNYSKGKWNESRINGNYNFSANNTDNAQKRVRENFLPNLNYTSEATSNSRNDTDTHTGGVDLNYLIRSKNKGSKKIMRVSNRLNFTAANSNTFSESNTLSKSTTGDLISEVNSNNDATSKNTVINNNLGFVSKTGNGNGFVAFNLQTNFSKTNSDSKNYSENILYQSNSTISQNQLRSNKSINSDIIFSGIWVKTIMPNIKMIPSYKADISHNNDEKYVYDFNETDDQYNQLNNLQSFNSKYVSLTTKPALKLRYDYKFLRIEFESAYTNTLRKYSDKLLDTRDFNSSFEYLTYSGRLQYRDKNKYKNIDLSYNQNVKLPTLKQLQPIEDVSNQTHIVSGNPLLNPEISHNLKLRYEKNIPFNNVFIRGGIVTKLIDDKIVNTTETNTDLIRYTTYNNINGNYSVNGNTSISKSYLNKKTKLNINLRLSGTYHKNISLQNSLKFTSKTTTITPSLSFSYSYDNKIDLSMSYNYSTNKNVYDTDMFNTNAFFTQTLRSDASIYFLKKAFFSNKISYRYNSRVGDEFDGDAVFWNAGLGVQLWDDKATLTLVGYDILGKNNGYTRTVTETYIEDLDSKILEQYFMATFVFKFGKIAGQNMNRNSRGKSGFRGENPGLGRGIRRR